MFEDSIRQGKARPDFAGTDDFQVAVTLHGQVQDPRFLQFLERVGKELQVSFSTDDLLVLDLLHRGEALPRELSGTARVLKERGVVEAVGRGRGQRFLPSRRFYRYLGATATHTRRRGLDRETNKELLIKYLDEDGSATIQDFEEVLRGLSRNQIHSLLRERRREGRIKVTGQRRGSRWMKP